MSGSTSTLFQHSRRFRTLGRLIADTARKMGMALQVRAERRALMGFNDAALKDMGLDGGRAHNEAARPFWDIPVDRLR